MASRPRGYGLSAEVRRKIDSKYDPMLAKQAWDWMEQVIGGGLPTIPEPIESSALHSALKDGTILCQLIGRISDPIKYSTSKMAFKQMENIGKFLTACEDYGVQKTDLFQTVDLYEAQNMPAVVNAIHALGRKAQAKGFNGPVLGPKESAANHRHFDEEALRAGDGVIGLQAGMNEVDSQFGMAFGKPRHIIDD